MRGPSLGRPVRGFVLASFAAVALLATASPSRADIVLFTATSQDLVGGLPGGVLPDGLPGHLPGISPGVSFSPSPAPLDGVETGPLGGITYGPNAFAGNTGGSTGFVHISYTIGQDGTYHLVWEVADVLAKNLESALATDNVRLNGSLLFGFEAGVPAGFTARGTVGTSGAVPNLAPTEGASFAYLDTTGEEPATVDTVDGVSGSRLISTEFTARAGDVLSLDVAFLTNDGDQFHDYGVVTLAAPEPGSLTLAAVAVAVAAVSAWMHKRLIASSKVPV
jgi:hypothetical protein